MEVMSSKVTKTEGVKVMQNNKLELAMAIKHYNRMKGFITYDIEERDKQEQRIILKQVIKVATDMLKELETK